MSVSQNAVLSWTGPTTNTDGSPLTDLASFNVKIGTTSGSPTESFSVPAASSSVGLLSAFPSLAPGDYFAVVTAVDAKGAESDPSNEVAFTFAVVVPTKPSAPVNLTVTG